MDKKWLEKAIKKKYINFHKYEDFEKIEIIGIGASGRVSRAEWANRDMFVAIKRVGMFLNADEDTLRNFIKEVIINFISVQYILKVNIKYFLFFQNIVKKSPSS